MNKDSIIRLIISLSFYFPTPGLCDLEVVLPVILKEGSPGEVLLEDSIVPPNGGAIWSSGSGTVLNSIQNQSAIPVGNYAQPGNLSQIRGYGYSSEDIDVRIFGISLNPPQGGGFNLTEFPQYLWEGYSFQAGPPLNGQNPAAASGTFTLIPWTVSSLQEQKAGRRISEFYSSAGVSQIAVSTSDGEKASLVAGYSSGRVVGPSGGVTTQWKASSYKGRFHVLATDLDSESKGSTDYPTPYARFKMFRLIPMLQNDFRVSEGSEIKTSVYAHLGHTFYRDAGETSVSSVTTNPGSKAYTREWGIETAYLWGGKPKRFYYPWKLGAGIRQTRYYSPLYFDAPLQSAGSFQISRKVVWQEKQWVLEPTFQMIGVNGFGIHPQGSLGVRKEWNSGGRAVYSRVSYSRRYPSLLERYGVAGQYYGNPGLQAETNWTGMAGGEIQEGSWSASVQGYGQHRARARALTENSVANFGDGFISALTLVGEWHPNAWVSLRHTGTFSISRFSDSKSDFPYVPSYLGLAGVKIYRPSLFTVFKERVKGSFNTVLRVETSRSYQVQMKDRLPGYGVLDAWLELQWKERLFLSGKVENLLDKAFEQVKGYPLGRSISLTIAGSF